MKPSKKQLARFKSFRAAQFAMGHELACVADFLKIELDEAENDANQYNNWSYLLQLPASRRTGRTA